MDYADENTVSGLAIVWPRSSRRKLTVSVGLLACGIVPLLILYSLQLWTRPEYRFFPMLLAGVACLAVARFPGLDVLAPGSGRIGAGAGGLSFLLLVMALALSSTWLAFVAALVLIPALIWEIGGAALLRLLLAPYLLLWLMLTPPMGLDREFIHSLQRQVSIRSSQILDLLSVPNLVEGNVIEIPAKRLFVDEACSGIHSGHALVAFTALFCAWKRRGILISLILLSGAAGFALLGNVLRILIIATFETSFSIDLVSGWPHEALGLGTIAFALLMTLSLDRLLQFLFSPKPVAQLKNAESYYEEEAADPTPVPEGEPPNAASTPAQIGAGRSREPRRSWLLKPWLPLGYAMVGLVSAAVLLSQTTAANPPTGNFAGPVMELNQVGDWRLCSDQQNGNERLTGNGLHSQVWHFRSGAREVIVSLDYPFPGWHDVSDCYRGQGWNILGYLIEHDRTTGPAPATFVQCDIENPLAGSGRLYYALVESNGDWLRPAPQSLRETWERLLARAPLADWRVRRAAYQLQAVSFQVDRLDPYEMEAMRGLFLAICEQVHSQIAKSVEAAP